MFWFFKAPKNKGFGHVYASCGLYGDRTTSTGVHDALCLFFLSRRRVFRHVFTRPFSSAVDSTDRSEGFGA
jgi:hypothetical protein